MPNNIRLVYEHIPNTKTVSTGVFIKAGCIYETKETNGISHFIEHMMFKGTSRRSARDISYEIDAVGGILNAFTAREETCFYTKTLSEHTELCFDLLSDMIFCSVFDEKTLDTEKAVVCDEIDMCEDSPEDLVHDILNEICYPLHPLGYNILGSKKSVNSFTREMILDYIKLRYCGENIVLSVAGSIDKEQILFLAEKYFGSAEILKFADKTPQQNADFYTDKTVRKKQTQQFNVAIALPGVNHFSPDMYAASLVNTILGSSASSRLFQHIREKLGLAYCIYSSPNIFVNGGYTSIYAGCAPQNAKTVLNLIYDEIINLYKNSLSEEDIEFAKKQLKGSCVMALEGVTSTMSENGRQLLLYDEIITADDFLRKIDAVTFQNIKNITDLFDVSKASVAVISSQETDFI